MDKRYSEVTRMGTYNCDQKKIAKLSGLLQVTQEAGRQQMTIQRPSYEELQAKGQALMLSRLDLAVYDTVYFDEPITVSSWPCEAVRATFPRMYLIERDGKPVVEVSSQWALVEMETRKILKADEADFSNFTNGEYKELFKGKFKIPRGLELKEMGKHMVSYSDLDYNGHMNNTFYADMLCDCIPELADATHRVDTLRIHYSKEAPLGDLITITGCCTEEGKYIFRTVKSTGETNIEAEITLAGL